VVRLRGKPPPVISSRPVVPVGALPMVPVGALMGDFTRGGRVDFMGFPQKTGWAGNMAASPTGRLGLFIADVCAIANTFRRRTPVLAPVCATATRVRLYV